MSLTQKLFITGLVLTGLVLWLGFSYLAMFRPDILPIDPEWVRTHFK